MRSLRHHLARAILGVSCLFVGSCVRTSNAASAGTVLTSNELRMQVGGLVYVGDSSYAVVRKDWLVDFYPKYRDRLFKLGVTKWDDSFDCNHFSYNFVALAQTDYYVTSFHDRSRANTLAVGLIWYMKQGTQGHSIVMAVTEQGIVYMEPQTGQFVTLTESEKATITLKLF